MYEQMPQGQGQRRVEIGLDGKPFEVWEPAPQPTQPAERAPSSADWVGGSYYPRGPAETGVLDTPRNSMQHNDFAWFAIGLAMASAIGVAVSWATGSGGMLWIASLAMASTGVYFGMRAHNAGLRGFCTNGRMGLIGLVASAIAAVATVVLVFSTYASAAAAVAAV